MSGYSAEEIENFLKIIDPLLKGYPEETVAKFKENVRNPKDSKTVDKAKLLFSLAESGIKFNAMALEDGVIVKDEKDVLDQYPAALAANLKSLLLDAQKQVDNDKKKEKPEPQKKSFLQKVLDFIKNPKTLVAASVIMPTSALADNTPKDDIDSKQQIALHYSPQQFEEALADVTEIVMQSKKSQKNQVSSTNTKSAPTNSKGGIER